MRAIFNLTCLVLSPESLDDLALRNGADMAILMAMMNNGATPCADAIGVGYIDKKTIGVVGKSCGVTALGNVSATKELFCGNRTE